MRGRPLRLPLLHHFTLRLQRPTGLPQPSTHVHSQVKRLQMRQFKGVQSKLLTTVSAGRKQQRSKRTRDRLNSVRLLKQQERNKRSHSKRLHNVPIRRHRATLQPICPKPSPKGGTLDPEPRLGWGRRL